MRYPFACVPLLLSAALAAQQSADDAATQWANWRGPLGTGVAPAGDPPTEWSEAKNIRWKVDLPGLGSSSPIVWRDRVYVTTAIETEEEGDARVDNRPERVRRFAGGPPPKKVYEFVVLALDRATGEVVWSKTVTRAIPHEGAHRTGTFASNSPLTDGEHIYASFGSRGLYCLDMSGDVVWSKDFGEMRTRLSFGEGSSPALYGDTLVVNWDHEGESFVIALNKKNGKQRWRKPRDEQTSWSTPVIVPVKGKQQVIIAATGASRAYDLKSGKVLWSSSGMTANVIPTPVHGDGLVYLMSGFRGAALQAIRLAGAKGDLEDSKHIVWLTRQGTSYTPSALLCDGCLYYLRTNNGVLSCVDAKTGEPHYEGQRLGMRTVYSSPVAAAGRVYVTSRDGVTKVLAAGTAFEELATNKLDDGFDATAAIVGNELFLRGQKRLYCIAEQ